MVVASDTRTPATAYAASTAQAPAKISPRPRFVLDSSQFLKLPEGRKLGAAMCVDVGPDGHIWVLHTHRVLMRGLGLEPDPAVLPEVVEFDEAGNFLQAWGGPDHLPPVDGRPRWPETAETIAVDGEGAVWICGVRQAYDHAVLRFSRDGALLLQIGRYGDPGGDESRERLNGACDVYLDVATREAFITDGYYGHRVVSFNVDTGAFIRSWGAYGKPPPTEAGVASFKLVHSLVRGPEGHLYVCDRMNNRVQVFDAIGRDDVRFVREFSIAPDTVGYGSVGEVAFSPDGTYFYAVDNTACLIWVGRTATGEVLGWFGGRATEGDGATLNNLDSPHRFVCDPAGNVLLARVAAGFERYIYQGVA